MIPKNQKKHAPCLQPNCTVCSGKNSLSAQRAVIEELSQKIKDLVSKDPAKAAIILTGWLGKSQSAKKPLKKVA